jgi:hypothetical protein
MDYKSAMDFWDKHGVLFIISMALFPRLTLLFSSVAFGGLLWWLGFIFVPRILVAVLATLSYLHTNPVLVALSWVWALSGETAEKRTVIIKTRGRSKHQSREQYSSGEKIVGDERTRS